MTRSRAGVRGVRATVAGMVIATAGNLFAQTGPGTSAGAPGTPRAGIASAQESPWDRSIALENANDLVQAKAVLLQAYGPDPPYYWVTLRLGWLSLRMRQADDALRFYRRAPTRPDAPAATNWDATVGLSMALTLAGYQALDRGDLPTARRSWQDALRLAPNSADARRGLDLVGPSRGAAPEVWAGYLSDSGSSSSASALFLQLPYRVNDRVSVRAAFRRISAASSTDASSTSSSTAAESLFGTQSEAYGALSFERGIAAAEGMALVLHNSVETVPGVALGLRAGGRYGVTATVSGLQRTEGWNSQVIAQGFVWPASWLALAGGARITRDPAGNSTSAVLGATLRRGAAQVDVQGHAGSETWAFSMAAPMVMSFAASTTSGATATASFGAGRQWVVCVQLQLERLPATSTAAAGWYSGMAAGVRWIPSRRKENDR